MNYDDDRVGVRLADHVVGHPNLSPTPRRFRLKLKRSTLRAAHVLPNVLISKNAAATKQMCCIDWIAVVTPSTQALKILQKKKLCGDLWVQSFDASR